MDEMGLREIPATRSQIMGTKQWIARFSSKEYQTVISRYCLSANAKWASNKLEQRGHGLKVAQFHSGRMHDMKFGQPTVAGSQKFQKSLPAKGTQQWLREMRKQISCRRCAESRSCGQENGRWLNGGNMAGGQQRR
ncbi:hypothetical protein Adt_10300 [Abeliophyllum distichum]|uniref:Uncharacterized protein n=1 Tax=Abeliophyllum distichum TaxID=126358 RepID=A0ABD1UJW6_9LAMI